VQKRAAQQPEVNNGLLKSNLHFGDFKPDYSTTYGAEHVDKGVLPKDGVRNEIMKDLRSNHYKLGYADVRLWDFWFLRGFLVLRDFLVLRRFFVIDF
jgi:hypothetical protein